MTFSTINKFFKFKGKMFEHPQFLKDFLSILFMSHLHQFAWKRTKVKACSFFRLFFSLIHEKKNIYNNILTKKFFSFHIDFFFNEFS